MQTNPLIQEIDQSLKSHYHDICFNPEKQETLRSLTSTHDDSFQHGPILQKKCQIIPLQLINNNLAKKYVQYVYHTYKIEDPIAKEFRLSNHAQHVKGAATTPNTEDNCSPRRPQKPLSTRSKLLHMRQSYKRDSSEILYSTQYHRRETERQADRSMIRQERHSKEIGYRTKQKIQFKKLLDTQPCTSATKAQTSLEAKEISSFLCHPDSRKVNLQNDQPLSLNEVSVVFRYCPMCQDIVLEHNIPFHEAQCPLIRQAYELPLEQLQAIFSQKVGSMLRELEDQMNETEEKKIAEFRNLKESVKEWLRQEEEGCFEVVKGQYQKVALNQYYLVTKLNWFKHLQRRIMRERQSRKELL